MTAEGKNELKTAYSHQIHVTFYLAEIPPGRGTSVHSLVISVIFKSIEILKEAKNWIYLWDLNNDLILEKLHIQEIFLMFSGDFGI